MEVTSIQLGLGEWRKYGSIFSTDSDSGSCSEKLLSSWIKASSGVKKFAGNISIAISRILSGEQPLNVGDLHGCQINDRRSGYLGRILAILAPTIVGNKDVFGSIDNLTRDLKLNLVEVFLEAVLEESILPELAFFWKSFGLSEGDQRDSLLFRNEMVSMEGLSGTLLESNWWHPSGGKPEESIHVEADSIWSEIKGEAGCCKDTEDEETMKRNDSDGICVGFSNDEYLVSESNIMALHYSLLFGLNRFVWSYILGAYGLSYILGIEDELLRDLFVGWYVRGKDFTAGCGTDKDINLSLCYFLELVNKKRFEPQDSERLKLAMDKYREKIHSLFSDCLPAGFEKILKAYLSEMLLCISRRMLDLVLRIRESNLVSMSWVGLKRELIGELDRRNFGRAENKGEDERLGSHILRLDRLQDAYESKFTRLLGINGSHDSSDLDIFVCLLKLVTSVRGTCCSSEGIGIDSELASRSSNTLTLEKVEEVLREISKGPISLRTPLEGGDCAPDDIDRADGMEDGKERTCFKYNGEIIGGNQEGTDNIGVQELLKRNFLLLGELTGLLFGFGFDVAHLLNLFLAPDESRDPSPMDLMGSLNVLAETIGLGETWRALCILVLRSHAVRVVLLLEKGEFKESSLRIYSSYVHNYLGPLLCTLLEGGICFGEGTERGRAWAHSNHKILRVYEELYMEYAWNLKRRLIDLIMAFPDKRKDVIDLFGMMNSFPSSGMLKEYWYLEISRDIRNYVSNRLLEPYIDTNSILGFYIKGIFFLLKLDTPNEWINRALGKLGDVLRRRGDTTQCIISWMPFLLENSSIEEGDSDLAIPITCSDEGIYPQFSLTNPNYRNEGRRVFMRLKDPRVSKWRIIEDETGYYEADYRNSYGREDDGDVWLDDLSDNMMESCVGKPTIKLVLEWVSRIYGNNLTLLHDFINNFAQRVLGKSLDVGFDAAEKKAPNSALIDEECWGLDEKGLKRDESVYELIKLTAGRHNGEDLRGRFSGDVEKEPGKGIGDESKDEQQLFAHCSVIIQDIAGSLQDNREYADRIGSRSAAGGAGCQVVTGVTLSRSYWSGALNLNIREDTFPLASVLEREIDDYRRFFELEHPGRTFTCYPFYGNVEADLIALDMSVKSGVKMNFLQISIYEYLSGGGESAEHLGSTSQIGDFQESRDTGSFSASGSASSSLLLNWFSLSPKSSEKQNQHIDGVAGRPKEEECMEGLSVSFEKLVEHFGLDEEIIRWNLESMISGGIVVVEMRDNKELFAIPQTFEPAGRLRKGGENDQVETDSGIQSQVKTANGNGFGISDMTVVLDFGSLVKGVGNEGVSKKKAEYTTMYDLMQNDCDEKDREMSGEYENTDSSGTDSEDFNLNFPTGMLTSTISTGIARETSDGRSLCHSFNSQGETSDKLVSNKISRRETRGGAEANNMGAISSPFIDTSETYLEKYCYFNTPVVLERPAESEAGDVSQSGGQKKSESGGYDIIRECELLIRGTLQLNGPMAPAVLFGRVRTAMAAQSEERTKAEGENTKDVGENTTNRENDTRKVLTWPHHVQAINNMVDRGEVCNKGGRLFLEN